MPVNVTLGSCVQFSVVFFDAVGNISVPSSGSLGLAYTSVSGSTASTAIDLLPRGSFFVTSWDTSVATFGTVNVSANAPGEVTSPAARLQLRLIGG